MKTPFKVFFITTVLLLTIISQPSLSQTPDSQDVYVCVPCGYNCDTISYAKPGKCTHCQMDLVKKSAVRFENIAPENICKYIQQHPTAILLDVRTEEEFSGKSSPNYGTLQNAVNIPVQQLSQRIDELKSFKNREIIVYCSHNHRSPQASFLLTAHGFSRVSNMTGGMSVLKDNSCRK